MNTPLAGTVVNDVHVASGSGVLPVRYEWVRVVPTPPTPTRSASSTCRPACIEHRRRVGAGRGVRRQPHPIHLGRDPRGVPVDDDRRHGDVPQAMLECVIIRVVPMSYCTLPAFQTDLEGQRLVEPADARHRRLVAPWRR